MYLLSTKAIRDLSGPNVRALVPSAQTEIRRSLTVFRGGFKIVNSSSAKADQRRAVQSTRRYGSLKSLRRTLVGKTTWASFMILGRFTGLRHVFLLVRLLNAVV